MSTPQAFSETCFVNQTLFDLSRPSENDVEIADLMAALSKDTSPLLHNEICYVIKEVMEAGKFIQFEDGSVWLMGTSYRDTVKKWESKERVKLTFQAGQSYNVHFENVDRKEISWGVNEKKPEKKLSTFILRAPNSVFDTESESKLILNNGLIFKNTKCPWKVREQVFVFHSSSHGYYDLWNLDRNERSTHWQYLGNEKEGSSESILNIEYQLNKQVLGQEEVVNSVSSVLFNCIAGLNDPKLPIGVFLFLGPTGVGKTELAKALTKELYKNPSRLIRFDMSQFVTQADYTRLIGSPPGYVNHEEGGQLTKALKAQPASVVLLDEIEKAHPSIHKAFLPIFDEGFVTDSKNTHVSCNRTIFIMTGNIGSEEIAHLFHEGLTSEEVLRIIEPKVISILSPELYNRLTTVVFRPITPELMRNLVDQKLAIVIQQLKQAKNLTLTFDDSVRYYLMEHGYHPTLGVRPLKRLIQNKIIAFLSHAIFKEGIPEGSAIHLSYAEYEDAWHLIWSLD